MSMRTKSNTESQSKRSDEGIHSDRACRPLWSTKASKSTDGKVGGMEDLWAAELEMNE